MIEQVINEIIEAEAQAEQMITEAQKKASEISLKTGELLDLDAIKRTEELKETLNHIYTEAEIEGNKRKEAIISAADKEAESIYNDSKNRFETAADSVIKIILGE